MRVRDVVPIGWVKRNGDWKKLCLPLDTLLRHMLVTGTTGWGKSAMLQAMTFALLTRVPEVKVTWVDSQGDAADELVESFLPALLECFPHLEPGRIVVIKPFGKYGVKLSPLDPMLGVSREVQANMVAALLSDLTDGNWGSRMTSITTSLCLACVGGGTLLDVLRLVQDPSYALSFASRVPFPESRSYLLTTVAEEPQAARDAVRARLEWLLLIKEVRAMLCADSSVGGAQILEAPVAVIDLGGSPQGFLPLARFLGTLVLGKLVGAIFSRKPDSPPVTVFCDEWQELVRGGGGPDFERCLAQARHHRVNLVLANQTLAQVAEVSATLVRAVLTNISLHLAFRPGPEDIRHLLPLLPVTGRKVDADHPDRLLSPEAERRELVCQLGRLPPRHALLGDFVAGRAEVIRTLEVPYKEARERAERVAPEIRGRFRQGRFGILFAELMAGLRRDEMDREEERTDALPAAEPAANPSREQPTKRVRTSRRPPLVLP